MKLVIATEEGDAYFGLLDGISNLEVVRVSTPDELLAEIGDADILYGRPDAKMLAAATNLKLVQSQSAGVDFLMNFPELVESDVVLSNTRGAHAPSIAEHAFGFCSHSRERFLRRSSISASINGAGTMPIASRGRSWAARSAFLAMGRSAGQLRSGASGFEVQMLAVDVNPGGGDRFVDTVWPVDRLHDMLQLTDILMVAAPLTRETHHMLGAKEFAAMPKSSIVIASFARRHYRRGGAGGVAGLWASVGRRARCQRNRAVGSGEPILGHAECGVEPSPGRVRRGKKSGAASRSWSRMCGGCRTGPNWSTWWTSKRGTERSQYPRPIDCKRIESDTATLEFELGRR